MDNKESTHFRIVKYVTGWSSGGGGQSTSFGGQSTAIINSGDSFTVEKKNYKFIEYKKGILTPELIIFSIFSVFALFFNILVHSFEQIPIAPKIICGIILTATFTPIIVSLARSPRRIIFKLNSTEFIALYFESRADRQKFLQCLAEISGNIKTELKGGSNDFYGYDVDVSFNMFDEENKSHKSNAKVKVENKQIKITTVGGREIYTDYFFRSHDLLWQLYPFASVFILMPIFVIFSSIQSGTFEKGVLFTLIFLVAGIIIMVIPSIISRGQLLLLNRDGYIRLSFVDSKSRRKFEREIRLLKIYKKKAYNFSKKKVEEKLKKFKIFNIAKYRFPVGLLIATVIYLALIAGLVTTLDLVTILVGVYIGFVFYSFFYIFYKDIIRQNFTIWLRKRRLEDSDLVTAEITDYIVKDFRNASKYFFNVEITTEYIQNGERKINYFYKEMLYCFPDYLVGQKVTLAVSGMTISLLTDVSTTNITVPAGDIRFPKYNGENLKDEVINVLKPLSHKAVDTKKPYRIFGQWRIRLLAYALSGMTIGGMVILFVWLMFNTTDSTTKIISAVILSIMTLLFALVIIILTKYLMRLICLKSVVKNGILTKAYILHKHTVIRESKNSNNNRITYTYYFKFIYFDEHNELKTGYIHESFDTNFSGYGLPDIRENSFINICTLDEKYAVLRSFQEIENY